MGLEIRENHGHESRKILIFKDKIGGERERERERERDSNRIQTPRRISKLRI
jgi:hypothetical protein